MFVGRKNELEMLEEHYNSNKAELMILYGRRRIGKTELLNKFIENKHAIYFSASETTKALQLASFSNVISYYEKKEDIASQYLTWENCFNKLYEMAEKERLIVVIDEFPYLVKKDESIPSILQNLWDQKLRHSKIMLILSGSSMSFIEEEILGSKKPLYGRATSIYKLLPLSYKESAQFVPNYSIEDKIITYSITSGVPYYLSLFNDNLNIHENIDRLILKRDGPLNNEVETLLREEFREISTYNSIISAIALGCLTFKSIQSYTNIPELSLGTYLNKLKELGIISKEISQYTPLKQQQQSKKGSYILNDGLFNFFYKYYLPNTSLFNSNGRDIAYNKIIEPTLHQFVSKTFENICIEYLYEENGMQTLPTFYTSFKRWWGEITKYDQSNKKITKSEEIDILGKPLDNKDPIILGECRFTSLPFDSDQYHRLVHKLDLEDNVYYYLFALNGFTDQLKEEAKENDHIKLIEAKQLY